VTVSVPVTITVSVTVTVVLQSPQEPGGDKELTE